MRKNHNMYYTTNTFSVIYYTLSQPLSLLLTNGHSTVHTQLVSNPPSEIHAPPKHNTTQVD